MAGFSAELQKLISAGNQAMTGKKERGARVDPGRGIIENKHSTDVESTDRVRPSV